MPALDVSPGAHHRCGPGSVPGARSVLTSQRFVGGVVQRRRGGVAGIVASGKRLPASAILLNGLFQRFSGFPASAGMSGHV